MNQIRLGSGRSGLRRPGYGGRYFRRSRRGYWGIGGYGRRCRYREGDIDRSEYQQEPALTKAALDATRVSVDGEVVRFNDPIEGLVEAWGSATMEEPVRLAEDIRDFFRGLR